MRTIEDAIQEHKKKVLERYSEDQILGIFAYGSMNYNLFVEGKSDIDTKAIIVPTIEDMVIHKNKIKVVSLDNGEHCEVMTVMHLIDNIRKQNINFVEVLFTRYCWINPNYLALWSELVSYKEEVALYNPDYCLQSISGQAIHTLKENMFDGKKVGNAIRLRKFIIDYFDEEVESYADCIYCDGKIRDLILEIKYKKLDDDLLAKDLVKWFEEIRKGYCPIDSGNKELVDKVMNEFIIKVIKKGEYLHDVQLKADYWRK